MAPTGYCFELRKTKEGEAGPLTSRCLIWPFMLTALLYTTQAVGFFPGGFPDASADLVCFSHGIFGPRKHLKGARRQGIKMPPLRQPKLLHDLGD